jgi:hypothetical protein
VGGPHGLPLGIISHHSVGDAPTIATNSKFLDFSNLHPYLHLVKQSHFSLLKKISTKKLPSKFFFAPKKKDFLTKMVKTVFFFLTSMGIFLF